MKNPVHKLLTLLLVFIGSSSLFAQTKTITFDATKDKGSTKTSVTKDGITITCSDAKNYNYYQALLQENIIITSAVGNIRTVKFTCTTFGARLYGPGNFYYSEKYKYKTNDYIGTWTGNSNPVSFRAYQQVQATKIEVTVDSTDDNNEKVTISDAGWATYVSKHPIEFYYSPVKAFLAKYNAVKNTIALTPIDQIPANTAVVLKGEAGSYIIDIIDRIKTCKAVTNDISFSKEDMRIPTDRTYYVLAKKSEGCGFYPIESGETLPAYKGYIYIPNSSAAKSVYSLNVTTGINHTFIRETIPSVRYNLLGQRVSDSYKGVIIENGKKFVVK